MEKYAPQPIPFKTLNGISKKTIEIHYGKLYQGYVKKTNEILEKMTLADRTAANQTYSEIGELKRQLAFALNGVILHEAYFESLGGDGQVQEGNLSKQIEKDFGSIDAWREDLIASGMASRGWVVLANDFNVDKLRHYSCDTHKSGGIWGCAPILVLDVYEHAYFIDFGSDRKSYIETFLKNLNFKALEKKYTKIVMK